VRLIVAFILGALVCFTALLYFRPRTHHRATSWDDDYDPNYPAYYDSILLSDKEIKAIQAKYDKSPLCSKSAEHPDGCAYATFLSSDDFVELCLVLGESLKAVNSKYPMIVFVDDSVREAQRKRRRKRREEEEGRGGLVREENWKRGRKRCMISEIGSLTDSLLRSPSAPWSFSARQATASSTSPPSPSLRTFSPGVSTGRPPTRSSRSSSLTRLRGWS
jgi:hypothetical protein